MSVSDYILQHHDNTLSILMGAVRRAERFLGPDDDWVEEDRRILFEAAQRYLTPLTGHDFVYQKGVQDYVVTADADSDLVEHALMSHDYQRNLASSRKYRVLPNGTRQWAVGSLVYDPANTDWQHHVYLFESPDGGTDVYGHRETSVREGSEHLTDTDQQHGDPRNRLRPILDENDIEYHEREI